MEFLVVSYEAIRDFMELGGWVLYLIAALLIIMWFMIIERMIYLRGTHKTLVKQTIDEWEARRERQSLDGASST